jgi:hypothetical protein
LKAPALAYGGRRYARLDAANFGGITNRLRCLLTCSAFSETTPHVYWDGNWSGEPMHGYPVEDAKRVLSLPLVPAASLDESPHPTYDDWIVLTPEIVNERRATAALCLDALNGDGLKSAEMLYQIPDPIFHSLQTHFLRLLSREYMARVERLTAVCKGVRYAVISLRFWSECVRSFTIDSYINRLNVNWLTPSDFDAICASISGNKWPRLRPSVSALRSARELIRNNGIDNIILMSDRWDGASFCAGSAEAINDAVLANFRAGAERQIANMFVIAQAAMFWRSKDSTYTHLPILLSDKWSMRIVDM